MTTHSAAAEQKATPAENEPERKSVVDDFAGYRALRRRIEDLHSSGLDIPFFAPRDGVSHSVIRRDGASLISFSGYNYLGLNGHPSRSPRPASRRAGRGGAKRRAARTTRSASCRQRAIPSR